MKYLVLRDCYGFMGKLWKKNSVVEIDPALNPPHHFKSLTEENGRAPTGVAPKQELPAEVVGKARGRGKRSSPKSEESGDK